MKVIQKITTVLLLCFLASLVQAQVKTLPSGLRYKVLKSGGSKKRGKVGDYIVCKIKGSISGFEIFSTKTMNKGQDLGVNFKIVKPTFRGDVMEGLTMVGPGDSAIFYITQDSFYRNPAAKPKAARPGDDVIYVVKVDNILTQAEYNKQQEDYRKQMAEMKKMQAQMAKQQEEQKKAQAKAKALAKKEDAEIVKYLAANGLSAAQKTASGMYYLITQQGTGEKPTPGSDITANYTGTLLNGTKFDSNTDSAFGHVNPLSFKLGRGAVIRGKDEAYALINKGAKATVVMPSALAYGTNAQGNIPANSILRYDIELLDWLPMKTPQEIAAIDDAAIQKYFADNGITGFVKAPTNSGLYYKLTSENPGGASLKVGDNLTMNYTGKLLDGTKFDSNVDSAFQHVQPFTFQLGKGQVIRGWDEGVSYLKKGEKATLFIPSGMGYGERGSPPKIPANAPLVFDVEVVDFAAPAPPAPPAPKK
jgi:FKBP-type peptidyl-prolyl cis-trans isomerase